jgi:nitroimidazol reductase NimA-like FMN-containing flavoprotein (pyridoxamine 5'-phosphate oxidase superfamily)
MPSPEKPPRAKVRRAPQRAVYEREAIEAILDEAPVCHVGIVDDGYPVVTPTLHVRVGDHVYVHGSAASRTLRIAASGGEVCLSAVLLDGFVLARSAFHHSVNYRSVTLFGCAELVEEHDAKREALEAFIEKLLPGRFADVRAPSDKELRATHVVRLPLAEASAKLRTGPPVDEEQDYTRQTWAGVVPVRLAALEPEPDPLLAPAIEPPAYLRRIAQARP